MGIPKKRKRIDALSAAAESAPSGKQNAYHQNIHMEPDFRLDRAFEIMERIEAPEVQEPEMPILEPSRKRMEKEIREGFRWHISLEALMPHQSDFDNAPDVGTKPLFDVGFTVPFFWGVPIVGSLTQKYLRFLSELINR